LLSRDDGSAALEAAAFLIEAIAREPARSLVAARPGMGAQFIFMIEMFERLERAERFGE
jgi:phytoene synthase